MKCLILIALISFSTSLFAIETLKGKFEIDNKDYELIYTYNIPFNQTATSQKIRILDDVRLPEQTEPMPAFCMIDITFSATVVVEIKNISTDQIVYTKSSTEYFSTSAYAGLVEANNCILYLPSWKEKMSSLLRVTDQKFFLNGKPYRYFMDTNVLVDAYGTSDDLIVSRSTTPMKGSDGKRDGEIWIDTQPTSDGNYQRVWAPLLL